MLLMRPFNIFAFLAFLLLKKERKEERKEGRKEVRKVKRKKGMEGSKERMEGRQARVEVNNGRWGGG